MLSPGIPTFDFDYLDVLALITLVEDVSIDAYYDLFERSSSDNDPDGFRRELISFIQAHAPSTALH